VPSPTITSQELTVELVGHPHFVDVSGSTFDGTVLLVCHGGPGYSELAMVRAGAYAAIQERAIVITWDQRGTARSFNERISPATMTVDQLTADTIELATWARNRFSSDKVHILGHSAGGTLALLAAHRAPALFHSVFALSPYVSSKRSAPITYRALLARAEQERNAEAIAELRDLGEPPYRDLRQGVETQAKWVAAFDHLVFGGSERANELFSRWQSIPGYTDADYERAQRGLEFSSRLLFDEGMAVDLFDRVPELEMPVAVGVGRHDLLNCGDVAAIWVEDVRAPHKRLYWFERSAHFPHFSEPVEFQNAVLTTMHQARRS
jgi:pimeloyl-ACP methyl ester carboxylesterase